MAHTVTLTGNSLTLGDVAAVARDFSTVAIDSGAAARLAEFLLRLKDDDRLRSELGVRARMVFEAQFASDLCIAEYASVLKNVGGVGSSPMPDCIRAERARRP